MESALLAASTASEEMLYDTCVDGIQEPWDPSVLLGGSAGREEGEGEEGGGQAVLAAASSSCKEEAAPCIAKTGGGERKDKEKDEEKEKEKEKDEEREKKPVREPTTAASFVSRPGYQRAQSMVAVRTRNTMFNAAGKHGRYDVL